MSNVPAARKELMSIAKDMRAAGVPHLADEVESVVVGLLHKEKAIRRAKKKRPNPTEEDKLRIKELAASHPDWSYQELAEATGFNIGRISETLTGKK